MAPVAGPTVEADLALVYPAPPAAPIRGSHATLVLLSGLPGDGKSYLARRLAEASGAEIVESDAVRLRLTGEPRFTPAEHRRVFDVCHALVERLLGEGRVVIMDATNLVEVHRQAVYAIAERAGARLIVVRVEAPESTARRRLEERAARGEGLADWAVRRRMRRTREPIARPHRRVDTSGDISDAVKEIAAEVLDPAP